MTVAGDAISVENADWEGWVLWLWAGRDWAVT